MFTYNQSPIKFSPVFQQRFLMSQFGIYSNPFLLSKYILFKLLGSFPTEFTKNIAYCIFPFMQGTR